MRRDLPTGTVTFLFTDVEGSTKLLHELGADEYMQTLGEHRRVVREACASNGGVEVDTQGDALFLAFPSAPEGVAAAQAISDALAEGQIHLRIGVRTGTALVTGEGYVGDDVHFAARVGASAHGGQVVLSQATRALVDGLTLTDLGEHRLKDIEGAVSIYQLGDKTFPPLKTISNTNLPRPASSFVGRDAELQEVLTHIERSVRLLTLTGPGGSGKTRLAIEAAATLVPAYKAGVFWIGLASLRESSLVTETIAQTLGAKDGLAEYIGEREMLLVLDNLEQVVEAAGELAGLLSACPNLTLLCTSRELLRIQGEVRYAVPPLASAEAVALFCERTAQEPSDVIADLCNRLDDLPLAVELAAARTTVLSPGQILERISQRLDLLTGGRDAEARQQTLRTTIAWSYDLLSEEEQRVFRTLSVFAGGCTLAAAEEVVDADLDTMRSLIEKSLLRVTDGRYWMLETIREYAGGELVEGGGAEQVAQRHMQHFLDLAETAEPDLWAQRTDLWLLRLDGEEANFRAALGWAIQREEAEIAVRLAGSLYPFWEIRARHEKARRWLDQALALDNAVPPGCRAKALVAAARATSWLADWSTALSLLEEAVALSQKLGDNEGVGRCLGFIGHGRLYTGDIAGAAAALHEGVELARSTGDRRSLARALYNAAWVATEERDFDQAREIFEDAARIFRAEGMKPNLALCLMRLGYSEALAGDFKRSASCLSESVALFDELGTPTWTALAYRYLGLLALLRGEIDEAESLLRTSLKDGREQAPQYDLPHWIEELGAVATAKGDAVRAATLWGATDALFEKLGLATLEEDRQVRERFGEDPGRSPDTDLQAEAWARGHIMTLQQAIAYALTEGAEQAPAVSVV